MTTTRQTLKYLRRKGLNKPATANAPDSKLKGRSLPEPVRVNNDHRTHEEDETLKIDELPYELQAICLSYAAAPTKKKEKVGYPHTTFFKKMLAHELYQAANDLLLGHGTKALALVTKIPWAIYYKTDGYDRFGTCIKGVTLLQLAAMLVDVNPRDKKPEEKDHGMVELLKKAGGLSEEEVAKQIHPVLFSDEAKKANDQRKKQILTIVKKFRENLITRKKELPGYFGTSDQLKLAHKKFELEIITLRTNLLESVSKQEITHGQIFPSDIFLEFLEEFENPNNLSRLRGWYSLISALFWVNAYGSLQLISAAPEVHLHLTGVGPVVDQEVAPIRSLKNCDGSIRADLYSGLGLDYYLGYYGAPSFRSTDWLRGPMEKYCLKKMNTLQCYAGTVPQLSIKCRP